MWHLYINRELLTRDEIAARGLPIRADVDPVEGFMEYLITTVSQFSGANGDTIALEFVPIEAGVGGKPDMYVTGTYGDYFVDFWNMVDPKGKALREMSGSEEWKHIRDGIIMAWGEGITPASDIGTTDIQNVAPTMMYTLGLPIAADMDGQVETKLFTRDFLREQPLFLVPDYALIVPDKSTVQQDREDLEKKMRSLGYIR